MSDEHFVAATIIVSVVFAVFSIAAVYSSYYIEYHVWSLKLRALVEVGGEVQPLLLELIREATDK